MPDQPPSSSATPIAITITEASIEGAGGSIQNATIKGKASIQSPAVPPGVTGKPEHPILLPPPSEGDQFWLLCFVSEPPPGHWEWISFHPGDAPERPQPEPPEPPSMTPPGEKPFPPDGGWGFKEPWGWIYWPGPEGAGPK